MIFPNFGFQKHQPLTPLFHQLNRNAAIHQLRSLPKPQRQCLDVFVHPCRAARAVRPASRDLDPQDPCRAGRTGPPSRRPRRSSSRRRTCPSLEEKLGEVSIRDPGVPNGRRSTLASPKSEKHPQPPSKQLEGRRLPSKDASFSARCLGHLVIKAIVQDLQHHLRAAPVEQKSFTSFMKVDRSRQFLRWILAPKWGLLRRLLME